MSQFSMALRLARFIRPQIRKEFGYCYRMFSSAWGTPDHYKTLGLKKGCTQKEIRDAYVNLSKKLHPDLGGAADNFAALNQAYQVLSNEISRRSYDAEQSNMRRIREDGSENEFDRYPSPQGPPAAGSSESEGFYGIRGVKRLSNGMIALICLLVVTVSLSSQIYGIQAVSKLRDDESKRLTALYLKQEEDSRRGYANLTREEKIQRLRDAYETNESLRMAST